MTLLNADTIQQLLATLPVKEGHADDGPGDSPVVADLTVIDGLTIQDSAPEGEAAGLDVTLSLAVDPKHGPVLETMRQLVEQKLNDHPAVKRAVVLLTAARPARQASKRELGRGQGRLKNQDQGPNTGNTSQRMIDLPGIRHVVAVASGKGGVGKSTVAANLAAAWAANGWSVGLLDADIYGPSVPTLAGQVLTKPKATADKRLEPITAHGLKTMSIGYLTDPEKALVWRGPMVQGALVQMLRDVDWGTLDALVIDLPPGTGDIQLTLAQRVRLSGAVIVSTPQDLALIDARRAIAMFDRVSVPILGMVENMSVFCCPECGHESHIFGQGGAQDEAKQRNVAYLGAVPLTMRLRELTDAGTPIVVSEPDDPAAHAFFDVAQQTQLALDTTAKNQRPAPTITWL
ncbi:MAG: Mrp/NBP35 family ATP-binding protein [Pseudomonadota bacterium]